MAPVLRPSDVVLKSFEQMLEASAKVSLLEILGRVTKILPRLAEVLTKAMVVVAMVAMVVVVAMGAVVVVVAVGPMVMVVVMMDSDGHR